MKHLLGIDAGTENVGFALTDENYNIVKINKKNAIGVLSYESADTADARRAYRITRRRYQRRKFRIDLLQEIFNDAIMRKDPNFLRRLDENDLKFEDRKIDGKYSLFNDNHFNDKLYYKRYPTIYHLRQELMVKAPEDIRLLYLAIHHIIKYRGHFLINGSLKDCMDSIQIFERINDLLADRNEQIKEDELEKFKINIIEPLNLDRLQELKELISNQGKITKELLDEIKSRENNKNRIYISKKDKKQKAYEILGAKTSAQKNIINTIFGEKVNLVTIFGADEYSKEEVKGFYFSEDYENIADLELLKNNDLHHELIMQLKQAYDWYILNDMLNGEDSISDSMVKLYEEHKQDLKYLKKFIKTYDEKNYDLVFGKPSKNNKNNYSSYIGGGIYDGQKIENKEIIDNSCAREDFLVFIKKIIMAIDIPESEESKNNIMMRIENDRFLPKIVSKNNSAIPYQSNMLDLEKILNVASNSGKYEFLKEKEKDWTNIDKIKSLLSFKIPYYVGPVKYYKDESLRSKNAWAIRKKEDRITPWNFDDIIDINASNEAFIKRMTNKCTYLKNANTLPKHSIIFSKFNSLNELNKLKINGKEICIETKQKIFDNIYMTRKATINNIIRYLNDVLKFNITKQNITGYDTELKGNMNSYLTYARILGDKVDKYPQMVERLIFLSTIHQDSNMIENSVRKEYENILSDKEINEIKGLRFNGWASLSAEFLAGYNNNGIRFQFEGEHIDLVDIMYHTNLNLQQILNSPLCNFADALKEYNERNGIVENIDIIYDDIDEMYCSPSVKRCIWQSFGLVKDIVKQTKIVPDKIFIESTRTNTDEKKGKRTKTRREIIQKAYDEAKKLSKEIVADIESYSNKLDIKKDSELNSEKLYLYFMQLGRCMYTGNNIDIESLFNNNFYDIDHIIPRSMKKDDSLDNKVLVEQKTNKDKGDIYPVPKNCRQIELWEKLKKSKLISDEKYLRLIRINPITAEEQEKFINRQLVETNQTVILLRDLLERYFQGTTDKKVEIILSRAKNVSEFRKEYELTKSREVNDFHHGADAYLNIVVGDILNKKYNHNWNYQKIDILEDKSYNFAKCLENEVRKNNYAILNKIYEQLDTNDYRITKKIQEGKGELYKATLFSAEDKKDSALYPRCQSKIVDGIEQNPKCDPRKYGGYKSSGTAYFVVVDSEDKKGKKIRTIEAVSIFENQMIAARKMNIQEILEKRDLKNPKLANIKGLKNSKLKVASLLDFGNYKLRLSGISLKQLIFHNANQLYVKKDINAYVKELSIIIEKINKKSRFEKNKTDEILNAYVLEYEDEKKNRLDRINQTSTIIPITNDKNLELYKFFINKLSKNPYKDIPTYNSLLNILILGQEYFINMTLYSQAVLLLNIICAFQCNAKAVDISKLDYKKIEKDGSISIKKGGTHHCTIVKNKEITNNTIYFISQSKSGLKENRILIT